MRYALRLIFFTTLLSKRRSRADEIASVLVLRLILEVECYKKYGITEKNYKI